MKKINLPGVMKNIELGLKKHSPQILIGFGVAGMVGATVLAVAVTPKAMKLIEEKKEEEGKDHLTPLETVQTTWKCYIPTAIMTLASAGCIIGSCTISTRRYAALGAAYKVIATGYNEYKNKVVETVGEEKAKEINTKVSQEQIKNNPPQKQNIILTGKGDILCLESLTHRYFRSSVNEIKRAVNEINKRIFHELYVQLNDFFDELGLPGTVLGSELGWNSKGILLDVDFTSELSYDNEPVLVINYNILPRDDYESAY